jgi:hypothetical protein
MPPELPVDFSDLSLEGSEHGPHGKQGLYSSRSGTLRGSMELDVDKPNNNDDSTPDAEPLMKVWHKIEYRNLHTDQVIYVRETDDLNAEPPAPKDRPVLEVKRVVKTLTNHPYHAREPPPTHSKGQTYIEARKLEIARLCWKARLNRFRYIRPRSSMRWARSLITTLDPTMKPRAW